MMFSHALVLASVVQHAAFAPSCAFAPHCVMHRQRAARGPAKFSSAMSYSNGEDGGETYYSPLPPRRRRGRRNDPPRPESTPSAITADDEVTKARPARHTPRRAMPHVQNESPTDAAVRAGYIIRQAGDGQDQIQRPQQRQTRGVVPLRRVVHRSHHEQQPQLPQQEGNDQNIRIKAPQNPARVHVRNGPSSRRSGLSPSKQLQLDDFLDEQEQLTPSEEQRKGARRVTFKATRESSKAILSKQMATLTEYMTQPVSQYSLLSFHDAEETNVGIHSNESSTRPESRRWLVRRLTSEEAQRYTDSTSLEDDAILDESNLFRLAVPLLPLIGWDLTPVIDLEVIPPKTNCYDVEGSLMERASPANSDDQAKWAPLRGIRKRMQSQGDDMTSEKVDERVDVPPVVKIRSLRVSLLSTQEEVKQVMSKSDRRSNHSNASSSMQKEAIEMVGKVEEWLRPHIFFEAEMSWNDCMSSGGVGDSKSSSSTVTVKSTAVTSLTIPRIPSDILRASVPSAFLVKRLGATLTSQALAICLPRFLRQLEKDYNRWSGLGSVGDGSEKNADGS